MLRAKTKGFPQLLRFVGGVPERAQRLPREARLQTSDKYAVIHQHGGRQAVTAPMQRAIAAKIGPRAQIGPPRVGSTLVHPERPIIVTQKMALEAAKAAVAFVAPKGPRSFKGEAVLRAGVGRQFSLGGSPRWVRARAWGRFRPRSTTLGGNRGRVRAGWRAGRYTERR